jgi:hypothetical protein
MALLSIHLEVVATKPSTTLSDHSCIQSSQDKPAPVVAAHMMLDSHRGILITLLFFVHRTMEM